MSSFFERIAQLPRSIIVVITGLFFLLFYQTSNHIILWGPWGMPLFPGESGIPFVAWSVVFYISVYAVAPLSIFVIPKQDLARALKALVIIFVAHTTVFILLPTQLPRVHTVPIGFFGDVYRVAVAGVDRPQNCFPSEHVALAVLTVCLIWRRSKKWGLLLALWALCMSISTLTVKQHYIVDVLGGAISGAVVYYVVFRLPPKQA